MNSKKYKQMKNPEISIIMSVYNSENFLEESIKSILNQTFKNFEFIIINDFSTDNSLNIIKKYKKIDNRIVLINNKSNLGLTKSLNIGINNAQGKFIARLDSDDLAIPTRLEKQYNFLTKNKEITLVGSGIYQMYTDFERIKKVLTNHKKIKKKLTSKNCLIHSTIMFRNDNYIYREKFVYSQDYDLYLNLLSKNKKIENINEPLVKYRVHKGAISWTKNSKQKLFAKKANEFYHQRLKNNKDNYADFDPKEILNIKIKNSTNSIILISEINSNFKLNNFMEVRKLSRTYFRKYGYLNIVLIYYITSFFGVKFNNFLKKHVI